MKKLILPLLFALTFGFQTQAEEKLYDSVRTAPEGLTYGTPADMKMSPEFFDNLVKFAGETKTSALIVLKDDKIIVEKYWDIEPDRLILLHSVTKSLLSLAVGKLLDEGRLSLSDPAKNWFKEWTGEKAEITVQQLLSQTSGYPDHGEENLRGPNRLKLSVDQKIASKPGTKFAYSNMGPWVLGEIVHQISKMEASEYVFDNFLRPLGIKNWNWEKDPTQHVDTTQGLQLSARDLLKVGRLMLNRGKWNQDRLISEKYLDAATKPSAGSLNTDYGYLWWIDGDNYYARGGFGQILAIFPKEKVILLRLQKSEPREPVPENSGQGWENRMKQFGNKIQK